MYENLQVDGAAVIGCYKHTLHVSPLSSLAHIFLRSPLAATVVRRHHRWVLNFLLAGATSVDDVFAI